MLEFSGGKTWLIKLKLAVGYAHIYSYRYKYDLQYCKYSILMQHSL